MLNYEYSKWDGTQEVFGPDADELMDRLSSDLLEHGDLTKALGELLSRGFQDQGQHQLSGLQDLIEQLQNQRQRHLQEHNMESIVDDLRQRLDDILSTERKGIQKRLNEAKKESEGEEGPERSQKKALNRLLEQRAEHNLEALDSLPSGVGSAIKELMDYAFIDPDAQGMFQELLDMLRGQMARNLSQEMAQRLQNITPEDMTQIKGMLQELNQMLSDKISGMEPNFGAFMSRFGHMFGPNPPSSLEELLESMVTQMSQMESLLDSISPEARRELEETLNSVLDPETQRELERFASLANQLIPMDELRRQYPFIGDESLTLDQAMDVMEELGEMDELEQTLKDAIKTGNLEDIDLDELSELLGEEGRLTVEQLKRLMEMLKEAGYISDSTEPELTPRAIRMIGQKALKEIFTDLKKGRLGKHNISKQGSGGEALGDTKLYEFGDLFDLDLQHSIKNALARNGPDLPVDFKKDDFEIFRKEYTTNASTVVLLDQSRSMGLMGSFLAAKKVAFALFALIHSRFPGDRLYVVGFSDYAREIKEEELPSANWNAWVSGTNIHHALMLSRRLLSKSKGSTRQILLITDGEPTAHLEGDKSYFQYPPSSRTV